MSGLELAGVVLGAIPLLIAAIENYENIIGPVVSYRKYSVVLKTFLTELQVQRDIFQNECIWILSPVAEAHELQDMLDDPSHHLRQKLRTDNDVTNTVRRGFGPSYSQVVNILFLIKTSLDEIYEHTKTLPEGLTKPTNSADLKAWRRHIGNKMKLSLGQESLNKKLDQLRHRNQAFLALSEQILRHNSNTWTPVQTQWDEQTTERNLEKIKSLRSGFHTVYDGFDRLWNCSEHPSHSANILLGISTADLFTESGSKMRFDVGLTCGDVGGSRGGNDSPVMLAIECDLYSRSSDDDRIGRPTRVVTFSSSSTSEPAKSAVKFEFEIQDNTPTEKKKASKRSRVRRALKILSGEEETSPQPSTSKEGKKPAAALVSRQKPLQRRKSTAPDLTSVTNLCQCIFPGCHDDTYNDQRTCIGFFHGSNASQYFLYDQSHSVPKPFSGTLPLSSIIQRGLSKAEKWRLAGILSMTTLLYHSTPWLHTTWRSDDILFFDFNETDRSTLIQAPRLHFRPQDKEKAAPSTQTTQPSSYKNELIHHLGLMLLELEFDDTMQLILNKHKRQGSFDSLDTLLDSPLMVLKQKAGEQLGTMYGRIVRMCLDCDFGLGLSEYSLDEVDVQKVFYSRIVKQFQERMPEYSKIWEE